MSSRRLIEVINSKVDRLIAENRKLRAKAERLDAQKERLKANNTELVAKIADLEKRISILELTDGISGGGESRKLAKARINRLMREVDKCIGLLNR